MLCAGDARRTWLRHGGVARYRKMITADLRWSARRPLAEVQCIDRRLYDITLRESGTLVLRSWGEMPGVTTCPGPAGAGSPAPSDLRVRPLVVGGAMTSEWLSANSTLIAALAGMASTVFVAIYMTRSQSRSAEAERRHSARQLLLTERKCAYEKMLQAFEGFDDTVYMLRGSGYGRVGRGATARCEKEVRSLLDRNSKVDGCGSSGVMHCEEL